MSSNEPEGLAFILNPLSAVQEKDQVERNRADQVFSLIVAELEQRQATSSDFKPMTLIRSMRELMECKQDFSVMLVMFVANNGIMNDQWSLGKSLHRFKDLEQWTIEQWTQLEKSCFLFAESLVDHFFLPVQAASRRSRRPSPMSFLKQSPPDDLTGRKRRRWDLQRRCLERDRHRCVVSFAFDLNEGRDRSKMRGLSARDDYGNLLTELEYGFDALQVCHILPHSLTAPSGAGDEAELSPEKESALGILEMFDCGILDLIKGEEIDSPRNALCLTPGLHLLFGDFTIGFEAVPEPQLENVYRIDYVGPPQAYHDRRQLPVTRVLHPPSHVNIEPPSPRILALHLAIGRLIQMSGAAEHINRVLRDMDELAGTSECENSELGRYIALRVDGWIDAVEVY